MAQSSELSSTSPHQLNQPPIPPPLPPQIGRSGGFNIKTSNGKVASIVSTLEKRTPISTESNVLDALEGFASGYIFLYGSLMDHDVLKHVVQIEETLKMKKATIRGYAVRIWGLFPALTPKDNGEVHGMV